MGLFIFLLFGHLFSFSMVKSTFCVLLNTQTLTSCNEELLLSELLLPELLLPELLLSELLLSELSLSELSQYQSSLNEQFRSPSESPVSYGDSSFGEAVALHRSLFSLSVHTNTDDTATERAHYITYVVLSGC
jgi:hypothetical protein